MTSTAATLAGRLGLDVLTLLLLLGWLHRRRGTAPEMTLVFTALNIGLFAAVSVIGVGEFPTSIGFGLFGLLSLVRLRSAAFTLEDVAYTFLSLVVALVNGLPNREPWLVVVLDVVVVVAVWVTDEARTAPSTSVVRVTLDQVVTDPELLRTEVHRRLGIEPLGVVVEDVDLVRETTRVWVRQQVEDPSWVSRRTGLQADDDLAEVAGPVDGAR